LLGGAVQIARRDACFETQKPRTMVMADLVRAVAVRISDRNGVGSQIMSIRDLTQVSVCIDPEIVLHVIDRLSEEVAIFMPFSNIVRVDAVHDGFNATLSLHWIESDANGGSDPANRARNLDLVQCFHRNSKHMGTFATCRALLVRQGAALDYGLDDEGNPEFAFVLPASAKKSGQIFGISAVGIPFANDHAEVTNPASSRSEAGRKRSGKMIIQSVRFGGIDVDAQDILTFPRGIIGFVDEREFVLIRTKNAHAIGWLQSVNTPKMALPVVSAHVLAPKYPDVDIESYADAAGIGQSLEELAILVVLNAPPGIPATVNLVAPIIVNATTRKGAQLLLEGSSFTTREIFILPSIQDVAAENEVQTATSAAE
jgi:flagellar assembly factor FliW